MGVAEQQHLHWACYSYRRRLLERRWFRFFEALSASSLIRLVHTGQVQPPYAIIFAAGPHFANSPSTPSLPRQAAASTEHAWKTTHISLRSRASLVGIQS